jgi:subtilase family serine protease
MPSMATRSFSKLMVLAALLAVSASGQTRNRIVQRIEDTEPVVVSAAHPLARAEFDQGRVEGSMKIDHAAMVFKLAPAQQAALEKLLAEQQNPQSPNYRKWLTPEQYAARFGMSDSDLGKVTAWLKSQGLRVDGFSRGRTQVFFSGTAAQVESAFRTEFHRYLVDGETSFANAIELSVPAALSETVLGFRGFDSFRPKPRARVVARPDFTSHVSGNHYLAPGDFATIYDVASLYAAGFDGTGQKIAVVGQTQINTADIDAFRSAAGLPATDLQLVSVDGSTGFSSGDEVEADLDVEWSGGVARNATILYVYVGASSSKNAFDSALYAVDQNLAPVISTSYGNCETNLGSFTATLRALVQQANTQGQTVTAASGDSGAADCELPSAKTAIHGLAVDAPASIPEVTGVGGAEFTGDAAATLSGTPPNTSAGATTYWGGTNTTTDNISSALSYIPEMAWNDTGLGGGLSASGGGQSTVFTKAQAPWQTALTPADGHRDVPDVALNASPNHDGALICSQGSCVSGFRDGSGNLNVVGGTSVGAPTFAGIVGILDQATQSGGLSNINPTLYSLASSKPSAFHDITVGNNIVPCTSGTPTTGSASIRCPTMPPLQIGYNTGPGYDLVTGLGSVDAHVLVTSWPGFVAAPGFSVGGTPISVPAPGQSGTSTVTVTPVNGFGGTVALTCVTSSLPAGAACASFSPSSETSGLSTLTVTTMAATPTGTSNIRVTGTSGAVIHTTSVSLTVVPAPTPDFTIAATALSQATVPAGGSATSTITVTATNGFTGTVSLTCGVTGGGTPAPTCAFVPTSVTNGAGSSTLTVRAIAPHVVSGASASLRQPRGFSWLAASMSGLFGGVFFLGLPSRRRRITALGLMLLLFFAAGVGCGGGGSSTSPPSGGTPAGSYTIKVTASSTSPALSHTANVAVTVQ